MSELLDPRIQKMASATKDPIVVLHKFNKLRTRDVNQLVLVVEGDEDPIFYSVIANRCGLATPFLCLVAGGKDLVLGFRELLKTSIEAKLGAGVSFAVDRDFDDLKGYPEGTDLYCTPTYSIENIACAPSAFRQLLYHEFKLYDPEMAGDVDRLTQIYDKLICDFARECRDINLLIYFGRTRSIDVCGAAIREIDDTPTRLFSIDASSLNVTCHFRGDAANQIVKFSSMVKLLDAAVVESEFSQLEPFARWRGKFWLAFLQRFLSILQEDRNSALPQHFSRGRGKVRLNPASDSIFRILGSACDIPPCMRQFFVQLPVNSLR